MNDVEQLLLGQARDSFPFVGGARGEVMHTWWIGLVGRCCRAHFSMCLLDCEGCRSISRLNLVPVLAVGSYRLSSELCHAHFMVAFRSCIATLLEITMTLKM